jgi:hypothetical protein
MQGLRHRPGYRPAMNGVARSRGAHPALFQEIVRPSAREERIGQDARGPACSWRRTARPCGVRCPSLRPRAEDRPGPKRSRKTPGSADPCSLLRDPRAVSPSLVALLRPKRGNLVPERDESPSTSGLTLARPKSPFDTNSTILLFRIASGSIRRASDPLRELCSSPASGHGPVSLRGEAVPAAPAGAPHAEVRGGRQGRGARGGGARVVGDDVD